VSRPWLALILALFCLPLFVELGRGDVQDDEAIYSFGVDRLLESGDWLAPKSSPHEDAPFLEKPPLKFWIVAGPIQLGLFRHHEFGIRFWDAVFGGLGLLYVFAIGSRLAGPVCGGAAVLLLFVHGPLLFEHGLRTNNMEAPLFLCYCAGVFHYLEWLRSPRERRTPGHAIAVGMYFVLGFMTKFVAALFLPVTLLAATLLLAEPRRRLLAGWRDWALVSAVVAALCAPWFIYAHWRFGPALWQIMFGEHVYTRFRTYLDPDHVQPWHYYLTTMWRRFSDSGVHWLVAAGFVVLVVQSIRRRSIDGLVVALWFVLPVLLISIGSSKIYHYAYPYLPPLALAGGYLAALIVMLAPVPIARTARRATDAALARWPGLAARLQRPAVRRTLLAVAIAATGVAIASVVYGPVRLRIGSTDVFRSSGTFRPALVILFFGVLAGATRSAATAAVALTVASVLPAAAYHATWTRLRSDVSPKRDAVECIQRVGREEGTAARGIYLDLPDRVIGHPLYYYFRRIRPWERAASPAPAKFAHYLAEGPAQRPVLTWDEAYQAFRREAMGSPAAQAVLAATPVVKLGDDVLLLLPGAYASCGADAMRRSQPD
jgi:4-amino-4-deoxy-L-arabinose transferase-like glycosyltransferase